MISEDDINELKRIATNTYENDNVFQLNRIIRGINELKSTVRDLQKENSNLKDQLKSKND
jgi:hypothetical protein